MTLADKYDVKMFIIVRIMNAGKSYGIEVISMSLESTKPTPTPNKVEAVNCETLLPEMSPTLLRLAN
jgi:hypothetical protein